MFLFNSLSKLELSLFIINKIYYLLKKIKSSKSEKKTVLNFPNNKKTNLITSHTKPITHALKIEKKQKQKQNSYFYHTTCSTIMSAASPLFTFKDPTEYRLSNRYGPKGMC